VAVGVRHHAGFRLRQRASVQHPARPAIRQVDHQQGAALAAIGQEGVPAVGADADVVEV